MFSRWSFLTTLLWILDKYPYTSFPSQSMIFTFGCTAGYSFWKFGSRDVTRPLPVEVERPISSSRLFVIDVPELLLKHTDGAKLPTPQRFLRRGNLLQHPSLSLRLSSLQKPWSKNLLPVEMYCGHPHRGWTHSGCGGCVLCHAPSERIRRP